MKTPKEYTTGEIFYSVLFWALIVFLLYTFVSNLVKNDKPETDLKRAQLEFFTNHKNCDCSFLKQD